MSPLSICVHFCHHPPRLGLSSLFSPQQPGRAFGNKSDPSPFSSKSILPLALQFPWCRVKPLTRLTKPCVRRSLFLQRSPLRPRWPFGSSRTLSSGLPQRLCVRCSLCLECFAQNCAHSCPSDLSECVTFPKGLVLLSKVGMQSHVVKTLFCYFSSRT